MRWLAAMVLLGALAPAAIAEPRPKGEGTEPLEQALAAARAASRPLVIEFYARWCEPCRQFEARVLPAKEVEKALAGAVFVRYDFDSPAGRKVARRYQVKGLPMFLALDGSGRELLRLRGIAGGTGWFVRFVRRAAELGADESSIEAELDGAGKAPRGESAAEVRLKAARWYRSRRRVREAIDNYEKAIEEAPDRAVAAEAAHELSKLTAAVERRKRVVSDAVSFVSRYPESDRAAEEIAVVMLSGDVPEVRREELLRSVAVRAPLSSLERVVYVALAAERSELALLAAQRLAGGDGEQDRAHLVLADAYQAAGDWPAARGAHAVACRRPPAELEGRCAEQQRRLEGGGGEAPRTIEVRREFESYFAVLEDPTVGIAVAARSRPRRDPALKAFVPAMRQRFAAAAKRCAKRRDHLQEVWVRLELAGAGHPPAKVVVLEPGAPDDLIDCLQGALDAPVPAIPAVYRHEFIAPVRFATETRSPRRRGDYDDTPALPSPLQHAYLYLSGMAGVSDTLGAGSRAVITAKRFGQFDAMLSWDVNAGVTSEGQAAYGVRALVGLAARPPSEVARISLLTGVGASRIGDALPSGYEVPVELVLTVSHEKLRGLAWARTAWIFGAEERKRDRGNGNALFGGDEFSMGIGVRVPASSPYGTFLATAYSHYATSQTVSIMLGTSVDSFR